MDRLGELTKRFGDEEDDSPYWIYGEPESIVGRLCLAGLLHTGTADLDGKESRVAVVPKEIRPLISSALSRV